MDVNQTITRITYQCGSVTGMLALRTDEVMQWREGKLPATREFERQSASVWRWMVRKGKNSRG